MHTISSLLLCAVVHVAVAGCQDTTSAESGSGSESESGASTDSTESSSSGTEDTGTTETGVEPICEPGETRCVDDGTLETCSADGLAWVASACEDDEICEPCFVTGEAGECVASCVGPCDRSTSTAGCSFFTTGLYQSTLPPGVVIAPDAIAVANPDPVLPARVELNWVPPGATEEVPHANPVVLQPGESHVFNLGPGLTLHDADPEASLFRAGAVHHVVSDVPILAHLYSPYAEVNANAATALLPEHALRDAYILYSHSAWVTPNYFVVIAIEDETTVSWEPSVETAGDNAPVPFVLPTQTGEMLLGRYQNLRIDTSAQLGRPKCQQDLSGTLVTADKPIWVLTAMRGLRLPWCGGSIVPGCVTLIDTACNYGSDFALEQVIPPEFWGTRYVGAHAPLRGTESHYWRVFAGEDGVTVTTDPPQPDTPVLLPTRGDWTELVFPAGTNVVFEGDGRFMPVQYLTGHYDSDTLLGSPAMVQTAPTEQYLDRYAFVTAIGYEQYWAQIVRPVGGADVLLDGVAVVGWDSIGAWEVASVEVEQGEHQADSPEPFGLTHWGYSLHLGPSENSAGYAYVVGMNLEAR